MRRTAAFTAVLVGGALFGTSLEAAAQGAPTVEGVSAASAAFDRAFNTGDMAALEALLTEQTVMVVLGAYLLGRTNVVQANADLHVERPGISMESRPESIQLGPRGWNLASEQGSWVERWTQDDGPVELRGTYQAVWRFREGRWLRESLILTPLSCEGPYCGT